MGCCHLKKSPVCTCRSQETRGRIRTTLCYSASVRPVPLEEGDGVHLQGETSRPGETRAGIRINRCMAVPVRPESLDEVASVHLVASATGQEAWPAASFVHCRCRHAAAMHRASCRSCRCQAARSSCCNCMQLFGKRAGNDSFAPRLWQAPLERVCRPGRLLPRAALKEPALALLPLPLLPPQTQPGHSPCSRTEVGACLNGQQEQRLGGGGSSAAAANALAAVLLSHVPHCPPSSARRTKSHSVMSPCPCPAPAALTARSPARAPACPPPPARPASAGL